ncbi:MAG: TolC family protein [Proteobacteria bacterium]|nr:TolC family protein [Pseudomonadota bacterium]
MKSLLTLLVCALGLMAGQSRATLPPLAELEQRARASLAMRTLDAALEAETRRARLNRVGTGPRLYGAAGYANSDEIVDETRNRSFGKMSSEVGLRVPVLGSRTDIRASQLRTEIALQRRAVETELAKRDLIRRLRIAYAEQWAAQRVLALSQAYLQNELQVTEMLRLRAHAGLLLDSDRLEFLSGFELVRRDAARAELTIRQSHDTLGALVDGDLGSALSTSRQQPQSFTGQPCRSRFAAAAWLDSDPEIAFLNDQIAAFDGSPLSSRWSGINSELRVGYQLANETTTARSGNAAIVAWTFDVPLDLYSTRRMQSALASADAAHATLERDLRRVELNNELQGLLAREVELQQSLQFAKVRQRAAAEAVRERALRATRIAGDVQEQLQASHLSAYQVAKSLIDAERMQWLWFADWARFDTDTCPGTASDAPMVEPTPVVPMSPQAPVPVKILSTQTSRAGARSLYLWTSEPWLASTADSVRDGLRALESQAIGTLMVSLDGAQIARYATDAAPLRRFASLAAERGMRVELLLGESEWLRPEHRAKLLTIVEQLRGAPFAAIHLDIEPDMLASTPAGAAALLPDFLRTVRAVRAATPLPLGISLHPRYLDSSVDGKPLGEQFAALNAEVALMIYVANANRVVEIAQPLLARYPTLALRVAVSIEHTLDREESLYHLASDERARRMALIEQRLAAPNFRGLAVQATDPWLASTVLLAAAGE